MTAQRRRRLSLGLALVIGVGVGLLGLGGSTPVPAPAPPQPAVTAVHRAPPRAPAPAALAPRPPLQRRASPNRAPRILNAALDRTHLCPGESTFLRVTADDPDDDDLRYRATLLAPTFGAPRFGFGRWLRFEAPERAGRYGLIAVVEDAAHARDEVPLEVVVDDCPTPPPFDASQLAMRHAELDAMVHEFDLTEAAARAHEAGKRLEVVRWQFGDGATQRGGLRARHQYPVVLQRRYSYYLVRADVSVDGAPARIDYGLTLYSYAAANLDAGYVALAADIERGDDSGPAIDYVVTFSNLTPFSAWARDFEIVCLDGAGLSKERWREPLDLTVPGETSLEQTLTLDRERCPGGASYELFGEAEGGYAVGGLWSYRLRPTAREPDAERARARARSVLTQETGS
jgi:hypothetical protein